MTPKVVHIARRRGPGSNRRSNSIQGMVILAVLVAIVIAAMIAGGALMTAGSGAAFSKASDRSAQLRSLAFSGVLGATAELASQRASLINGAAPQLTGEWELFHVGEIRGSVRLLPIELTASASEVIAASAAPAGSGPASAQSEAAYLNVGTADEAMLASVTNTEIASSLIQQRDRRTWTDRSEMVQYLKQRPASTAQPIAGSDPTATQLRAASINSGPESGPPPGLQSLTAASFEPQTSTASDGKETPQTDISQGISETAAATLTELLGAEVFAKLQKAVGSTPLTHRSDLIAALRRAAIPQSDWEAVLDVVCFDDRPFAVGRIDMNRAPADVLACVPGLGAEAAAAIVRTRDRLDDEKRRKLMWPLLEQVLTPDQFQTASDWLTTKSLVWTIRVEATITRDEPKATLARTVWTVVIDVADPTPRIVSIRDQMLQDGLDLAMADFPTTGTEVDTAASNPIPNNLLLDSPVPFEDDAKSETAAFGGQDVPIPADPNPPAPEPVIGKDNRIGRWTTGSGR